MMRVVPLVFLLALGMAAPAAAQGEKTWKAGVAKLNITPEKLMWMSGYGARDRPAEGKLTELWAKALVLEDPDGRRAVLLTMDLVGIDRDLSVEVCAELKKQFGLPRDAILLNCSHTHTGPVVRGNLQTMYNLDATQRQLVADYGRTLSKKLVQVVGAALKDASPANLSWGVGIAEFAVNRRNNKEAEVARLKEAGQPLKGPVDHDVPVLAVRGLKGQLRAVVFGYACHATVLSFYQWSGDYPGFAQMALEKKYPGAVALFWAGCGGDQNPLPRRTVALAQQYGDELAAAVGNVLGEKMAPVQGDLRTSYAEIDLPFAELPTRQVLVEDSRSTNKFIAGRAKALLAELDRKGQLRGNYPYPVQAWQLGKAVTWVALGGEVVVDYARRLKKELDRDATGGVWVAGYSNDVMAYIPSLRVLKEGGYEGGGAMVYYGLPTVWAPRVEESIIEAVHSQAGKVRAAAGVKGN
jgi:hypothetical protein